MKKGLVLLLWLFGSMLFAVVDIASLIRDVQINGATELAGKATFWITTDDFADTSGENPVYISIRLEKNALLSETLVDIQGSAMGHDPIALPIGLQTQSANTEINIPQNAISIVRWRAGEKTIWLKVTSSSSAWVLRNGVAGAPSLDDRIFVTLGNSLSESGLQFQDLFDEDLANLVVPTRLSGAQVDAPIVVDLTQSNIQPAPHPESILGFDPISWGGNTSGVETSPTEAGITPGFLTFPPYSGDNAIARAIGLSQERWIYYFSTYRGKYASDVIFFNRIGTPATMTLRPFDHQGMPLDDIEIDVDGNELRTLSAETLFGNQRVSHCQIIGSDHCVVTVTYNAHPGSRLTSHVPEADGGTTYWEYFPEDPSLGKDFMVVVNLGNEDASLEAVMLDSTGATVGLKGLFVENPIPPKGSAIIVLHKILENPSQVAMFQFTASQKMGVFAMRRSNVGGPGSLIPVQVITTGN